MYLLDGKRLVLDRPFSDAQGTQYPANWLRLTTPEERAAIGIIEVDEAARPDDRYYIVTQNPDYTYSAVEKPIEDLRTIFSNLVAARRYVAETAGITVAGLPVQTDRQSQATFTGAAVRAMRDPNYTVKWKTGVGFVELTNAQILALADAVGAHVQACFDHEGDLQAAVSAAGTLAELLAIDTETGWP